MKLLGVYKNLNITFGELDAAMQSLNFKKRLERTKYSFKEEFFGKKIWIAVFFNEQSDRFYRLTQQPANELVPKHEIVKISDQLYQLGFIKDYDDLAKLIEKNRVRVPEKIAA